MEEKLRSKREIVKVAGRLRELVTITDARGKVLHSIMNPIMVKFYPRDVMQVIVGASILAIPVAFTEETWNLGESLPLNNILALMMLSLTFISAFVYYNYYRGNMKEHRAEFMKRVLTTYLLSFLVVALLLTIIERAPWESSFTVAFGRVVIVSFPASMSAAVADMIK
jgi:uncharacterized membrane protein